MKNTKLFLSAVCMVFALSIVLPAFADKTSVSIEAPLEVKKGTEITITINVKHHGNNFLHYTNWVYVMANGKEIARWNYSWTDRPDSENFTKQVTFKVTEKTVIESEANCNIHGSAGKATATVKVK